MNLRAANPITPAEPAAGGFHDSHAASRWTCLRPCATWLRGLGPLLCCARPGHLAGALCRSQDPLLLGASAEIRAAGPREWLSLETLHGAIQARLYLLPDTDFCQWDALCARLPCRNATLPGQRALAGTAQVLLWTHATSRLRAVPIRQLSAPGQWLALQLAHEEACQLQG